MFVFRHLELGLLGRWLGLRWLRRDEGPRLRRQPLEDVRRCLPCVLAVGAEADEDVAPRARDLPDRRAVPAPQLSSALCARDSIGGGK